MPRIFTAEQVAALTPAQAQAREQRRVLRVEEKRKNAEKRARQERESLNPLLELPEAERAKLFTTLRDCPYNDAVLQMLREKGITATLTQLTEFFQTEARAHWELRIERAAYEANALVQLVEENPASFSSGMLAALGQETFRQIASGQAQPESMNRMAMLFLRAKADERADKMSELKREKLRLEMRGNRDLALEQLSEEVKKRPSAREKFEALRRDLAGDGEEGE